MVQPPKNAINWNVDSSQASKSEYVLGGAIQLLCELEKSPSDPKLPYKAYIIGLKRLTLKARFASVDDGLKAAKAQLLVMVKAGL